MAADSMAAALTFTLNPTQTPIPTETLTPIPTATPDMINLDMLHKVPQSYEYLLTHPKEFVQSPDPITDRAAYDKWFVEKFVPALGPVEDRPVNLNAYMSGSTYFGFEVTPPTPIELKGELTFFHFVTGGVEYPVLCINSDTRFEPDITNRTFCTILFDAWNGTSITIDQLRRMANGGKLSQITILNDLSNRQVDVGPIIPQLISTLGIYDDKGNHIAFGFGVVIFRDSQ